MADKGTTLSITIRTIDAATAKIKAINEELDKATKPVRDFKKQLGEFKEKSGLSAISEGFHGVGEAVKETGLKLLEMTAVVGEAAHLVLELADHFEDLGKKAKRIGVGVDFLAEMRDAAERAGAPVDALDSGMQAFSINLGRARAGAGKMAKFVGGIYPPLLASLKGAKSNEEAFNLLADAMSKLKDPAKQAALAQATVGDAALAPLLVQGSKALQEQGQHYLGLAGSQEEAADKSIELGETMKDLKAAGDGVKAALITGLAPALRIIVDQIKSWLVGHRDDIKEWAVSLGEKLPAAFDALVGKVRWAIDVVGSFLGHIGGIKAVAVALAAVLVGPLISAFTTLGVAVLTSPIGLTIAAWTAAAVAAVAAIYGAVKAGKWLGEKAAFAKLTNQHFDELKELNPDASNEDLQDQARKLAAYDIAASHAKEDADDKRDQAAIDAARNPDVSAQAKNATAPDVSDQARTALAWANANAPNQVETSPAERGQVQIKVDIANAPPGTRVTADSKGPADVDMTTGYNLMPGMP